MQRFTPEEAGDLISPDVDTSSTDAEWTRTGDTSAETSEEECSQEEEETYLSKNGLVSWSSVAADKNGLGRISAEYILKATPGPTRLCASLASDIVSSFKIFLPATMVNIIIDMSNLEGTRRFGHEWNKVTKLEFEAFVGLLLLSGVLKSSGESIESLWREGTGRAIFPATMSKNRFRELTLILRFDDRETRFSRKSVDRLAPIREVWDIWANNLPLMYNLGHDITIDESLFPFKGRCQFRQYIPRKPGRYGIKFWVACDAKTHYCWKIQPYTGKPAVGEKDTAERVVLDLIQGLKGHNVTVDSFFTSFHLGRKLLKRQITMIGTVRRNRPELPPALLACKGRQIHSSKFAFTSKTSIVSYMAKKRKNVLLMSTFHRNVQISDRQDKRPNIILDYNKTKGGVDTMDQLTTKYTVRRKTPRWPLAIFYNMLDIAAHNAFTIWREIQPKWKEGNKQKRRLFLQELGEALVNPFIEERPRHPRNSEAAAIVRSVKRAAEKDTPSPSQDTCRKRRRCVHCKRQEDIKTRLECKSCSMPVCKHHSATVCQACY